MLMLVEMRSHTRSQHMSSVHQRQLSPLRIRYSQPPSTLNFAKINFVLQLGPGIVVFIQPGETLKVSNTLYVHFIYLNVYSLYKNRNMSSLVMGRWWTLRICTPRMGSVENPNLFC